MPKGRKRCLRPFSPAYTRPYLRSCRTSRAGQRRDISLLAQKARLFSIKNLDNLSALRYNIR